MVVCKWGLNEIRDDTSVSTTGCLALGEVSKAPSQLQYQGRLVCSGRGAQRPLILVPAPPPPASEHEDPKAVGPEGGLSWVLRTGGVG